ncbi:hypothetical protein QE152_g6904, partial [Popillia japonica]
ATANNNNQDK